MELDDLLKKEGLDAAGVEDALEWARDRAAELVREMEGDPELGPLLDGGMALPSAAAAVSTDAGPAPAAPPMYSDLHGLQVAFLSEQDEEAQELPEVGAVLRVFQKARTGTAQSPAEEGEPVVEASADEASAAEASAAEASADEASADEASAAETSAAEAVDGSAEEQVPEPPEADLDPLAGIDFDDLPGIDDDDDEEGEDDADHTLVDLQLGGSLMERLRGAEQARDAGTTMAPSDGSEMTLPSMQAPLTEAKLTALLAEAAQPSGDLTERAHNPLLGDSASSEAAPSGEAARATEVPREPTAPVMVVEADEIELLDDDDLLLVEEEEDDDDDAGVSVPEWRQALVSAQHEREEAAEPPPPPDEDDDVDVGDL